MKRLDGSNIPTKPRVAVIANDAIGNWVMATPLLQMIRDEWAPTELHLFCGARTREFQEASDLADRSWEIHGASPDGFLDLMKDHIGRFDVVLNLESTGISKTAAWILGHNAVVAGPCIGPGGRGDFAHAEDERGKLWNDKNWIAADLVDRYPFLRTGFICEIFARLCYLEGEVPAYSVPEAIPGFSTPEVLFAASASLPEKLWPSEAWQIVIENLALRGLSLGLIGAKPSDQSKFWLGSRIEDEMVATGQVIDLRGSMTLPEVCGALRRARLVVSLDNGILHLAVAMQTSCIGLYRHGIHRLWAPPSKSLSVLTPGEGGSVAEIAPSLVLSAIDSYL